MARHNRRNFLKIAGSSVAATGVVACKGDKGHELMKAEPAAAQAAKKGGRRELAAQCPYCGVGCATMIQAEGDRIVGMVPDQVSPVNKGVQCIKGLTAWEPTYTDRLTACLVRKDMSDPMTEPC